MDWSWLSFFAGVFVMGLVALVTGILIIDELVERVRKRRVEKEPLAVTIGEIHRLHYRDWEASISFQFRWKGEVPKKIDRVEISPDSSGDDWYLVRPPATSGMLFEGERRRIGISLHAELKNLPPLEGLVIERVRLTAETGETYVAVPSSE